MSLLYEKESYEIRGACFWIWKEFGSAFKEAIIDRAFSEELKRRGLKVENQKRIDICYQNKRVGTYIPDKVINDAIIIELKSKPKLTKYDIKQFWHYLKGTSYRLGFLVNFGDKLEIKRVIYDEARRFSSDQREDPRKKSARRSVKQGFSLVEVVIIIAVAAGIFFVVASLRGNVSDLENIISQKLLSRQDLDQTFQVLVTEVRSAGPSGLGAYPIESASTSSLVFFSDIDQDGVFERVRYSLVTSTILKGIIEPVGNPLVYATSSEIITIAIENVVVAATTSLNIFEYFDLSYTGSEAPLAEPVDVSQIRVIKIIMYVDVEPGVAPRPALFTEQVTIRNLRE